MRGPRSEGHDRGQRAGARGRAAGAVECEGEDGRGAAVVTGRERGRGEPRAPSARARARGVAADVLGEWGGGVEATAWRSRGTVTEAGAGQGGRARDAVGTRRAAPRKKGVRGGAGEVEEVAGLLSPATGRRYPAAVVGAAWRTARLRPCA